MTARKFSETATSTRVWQRMLSGRRLDLLDPSPLDIEIADIAHGLARVARWNGQTSGAHIFSVAQHTLLVEAVMREQTPRVDVRFRLAALLHDAPEYVIGDMTSRPGPRPNPKSGSWRGSGVCFHEHRRFRRGVAKPIIARTKGPP